MPSTHGFPLSSFRKPWLQPLVSSQGVYFVSINSHDHRVSVTPYRSTLLIGNIRLLHLRTTTNDFSPLGYGFPATFGFIIAAIIAVVGIRLLVFREQKRGSKDGETTLESGGVEFHPEGNESIGESDGTDKK